jgi:hypothetical protein
MILNETVAKIAEAIREKTGKSELIAPVDFAEEIKGITAGGGDAPSGDWEYYDCSSSAENMSLYAAYLSAIVKKAEVQDGVISKVQIGCVIFAFASSDYDKYIAIAVDFSQPCIDANGTRTLREQIASYPNSQLAQIVGMLQSFPRLTKEQFYDLNA